MAARLRDFLKAQFSPFLFVLGCCVCVFDESCGNLLYSISFTTKSLLLEKGKNAVFQASISLFFFW